MPQNYPQLYEHPLWPDAVEMFIELNGREPATDSDFEAGPDSVVGILESLSSGQVGDMPDARTVTPQDMIMQQMGEDPSVPQADPAEMDRLLSQETGDTGSIQGMTTEGMTPEQKEIFRGMTEEEFQDFINRRGRFSR